MLRPVASQADSEVTEHMILLDIPALLQDCKRFPDKRVSIEDFLMYGVDYDAMSYAELLGIEAISSSDSSWFSFYSDLRQDREDMVLENVSSMSIPEMLGYYKENQPMQGFLRPFIEGSIYPVLDNEDYAFVRFFHEIATGTPFSHHADSVWKVRRDGIIPVVRESLLDYCRTELQFVDYLHSICLDDIQSRIASDFESVLEKSLDAIENSTVNLLIIEKKSASIYDSVTKVVMESFSKQFVDSCVVSFLYPCISQFNEQRNEFVQSIVLREDIPPLDLECPVSIDGRPEFVVPKNSLMALEKMLNSNWKCNDFRSQIYKSF